jgi:predicted enzyme related to lactoylglutathione lyase
MATVADDSEPSVFRPGGVSYLRIPAPDPPRVAAFYRDVFGWTLRGRPGSPCFDDGTGHVIGQFMSGHEVAGEGGVRPYVYVDDVDATVAKALDHGGEIVTPTYPEGDLWVAVIRDPAGNVVGAWQQGPRTA